jgi:uncharacterized protein (TIGR03437 family)
MTLTFQKREYCGLPGVLFPAHRRLSFGAIGLLSLFASLPAIGQVTGGNTNPYYTAQSIVNGATQTVEALAPNVIATVYGTNLSFGTYAVGPADISGGKLPTVLDGVGVWVGPFPCSLFMVSPTQINFLVPYSLTAGTVPLVVSRQSLIGPTVNIQLNSVSPGLFVWNGNYAVAAHLNGQVISATAPASAGEIIVVYAAGLGRTAPDTSAGQLATSAFPIVAASQLQILLNGTPSPPGSILYAGLAPGYAGLYQINVQLPGILPSNPQIQLSLSGQTSPSSIQLYTH